MIANENEFDAHGDEEEDIITITMPCLGLNKNYARMNDRQRQRILPIVFQYVSQADDVKTLIQELVERIDDDLNLNVNVNELSTITLNSCSARGETENIDDDEIDYNFVFAFNADTQSINSNNYFEWNLQFEQVINDDDFKEFLVYLDELRYVCCIRMILDA